MMLKPPPEISHERDFLDTVDDLDSAIHLAQLMREIDELSTHSDGSDSEKLAELTHELEATRRKLRFTTVD